MNILYLFVILQITCAFKTHNPLNTRRIDTGLLLSRFNHIDDKQISLKDNDLENSHFSARSQLDGLSNNEIDEDKVNELTTMPYNENQLKSNTENCKLIKIIEQPTGTMELQHNFRIFGGYFFYGVLFLMVLNTFKNTPNTPNTFINMFGGMGNMNSKNDIMLEKQNISLSSFMGSPEIFEECIEIISFFKDSEKYKEAGVDIPKGFLLEGPPGTGKTLLAKIIASECDTNFISASGSDFVELYVGYGALKIRKLFETARKNKPCIIFIDEIDAVGKARSMGMNTNDEREQTLNQLLYEMDGFNDNDNIMVLASTNRHDVLDKALIRPGRFDRIINVPSPDKESRRQILEMYLNKKKFNKEITIDSIVELTDGMTGAEIKNLVNEAGIEAVKRNTTIIESIDIFKSLDKLIIGITKKIDHRTNESKRRVAIHELGHAFIVKYFPDTFKFTKVTIQATYTGIEGYTIFTDYDDDLHTKYKLKNRIVTLLGGRVAEDIYYGKNYSSIGASRDIEQANLLAKQMIDIFGFGDTLALGEIFSSENTKSNMEQEIIKLLHECYREAESILLNNKEVFDNFIDILLENETIYSENFPYIT